jgi:LysM repeat protein
MYCINYEIKQGDTLYSISRHFNVRICAIMDANPLVNVYSLMVGETIYIPVSVPQKNYTHFTTYLVREEDSLGNILDENSINLADLLELNHLDEIYLQPGTTLKVPIFGEGEGGITL